MLPCATIILIEHAVKLHLNPSKETSSNAKDNLQRTRGKLSNANFTDKAAAAVVDKECEKLTESLNEQLLKIQAL